MRKFFGILGWVIIIGFSAVSFTLAYTQEEISAYNWAYKNGITTQSNIEDANLNGKLTRQELSKMLTNYIENVAGITQSSYSSCYFTDEDKMSPNLKPYTRKICSYKIMGTNGEDFRPTSKVNRAELGTTISRMLWGDRYEVGGKDFYIYHLNALKDAGIMNNIENPTKSLARRGDTFIMLKRLADRYGSNINLNEGNQTDNSGYVSNSSSSSNIIYVGKDGTEYYYDEQFIKGLKVAAQKKGESDLAKYLGIELEFYANVKDAFDFDTDKFAEEMGIDLTSIDEASQKEKEEIARKFKTWANDLAKTQKKLNNEYIKNLGNLIKNIENDKFKLKDKYERSAKNIEKNNKFVEDYCEILGDLVKIMLTDETNEEESMATALSLMGIAIAQQNETEQYQEYLDNWARETVNLLGSK